MSWRVATSWPKASSSVIPPARIPSRHRTSVKNPPTASSVTGCNPSELEARASPGLSSRTSPVSLETSAPFSAFAQSHLSTYLLEPRPRKQIPMFLSVESELVFTNSSTSG